MPRRDDRSKRAKLGMPGMMMQMQPHMMPPHMMPMMSPANMMMPQMPHMGMHPQNMMTSGMASSSDEDDQAEPTATASSEPVASKASAAAPPPPGQVAQSNEHIEVARHMQQFPSEAMKQRFSY